MPAVTLATLGTIAPQMGHAQSGSFGGSFEGAADTGTTSGGSFGGSFDSGAAQPPANTTDAPADNFGGSFGDTAVAPETSTTPQTDVPVVGGDSFGPSSFDPPPVVPEDTQTEVVNPPPPPPPGPPVDPQLVAFEGRDYGIPPSQDLRQGNFHGPTPTSIPGAQVVSTQVLAQALQGGQQVILIDVLGSDYSLPNAYVAPAMAAGGGYNDRTQQQATQWLRQITGGNSGAIIVLYCSDPMCWLSYNAALRAVAAGYSNVYWYRGGLRAWQMAGLQLYPTGF